MLPTKISGSENILLQNLNNILSNKFPIKYKCNVNKNNLRSIGTKIKLMFVLETILKKFNPAMSFNSILIICVVT